MSVQILRIRRQKLTPPPRGKLLTHVYYKFCFVGILRVFLRVYKWLVKKPNKHQSKRRTDKKHLIFIQYY